jgi:hypothetical protein|tara:strand:+ start:1082 stop:1669 length:588 start_codon:yes stop_codon:yes gene_type:complete
MLDNFGQNVDPQQQVQQMENQNPEGGGSKEIYSQGVGGDGIDATQIKHLLSNDDLLVSIECFLRGRRVDPFTGKEVKTDPLMNEEGINRVMQVLTLHCDKMFQLSSIQEIEVRALTLDIVQELNKVLHINAEEYELNEHEIPMIVKNIGHSIYMTLKKSQDGNFQGFLRSNFKTIEHTTPQSSGFSFGKLFPSKR